MLFLTIEEQISWKLFFWRYDGEAHVTLRDNLGIW